MSFTRLMRLSQRLQGCPSQRSASKFWLKIPPTAVTSIHLRAAWLASSEAGAKTHVA